MQTTPLLLDLSATSFDDSFVQALPADHETLNISRDVRDACYTFTMPTPVRAPHLLAWSEALGHELGIARPASGLNPAVEALAGNHLFPGMRPYASRYGGHQFGNWAGQLGDGRALTLGEIVTQGGQRWELQLKGAGRTPYSRHADGRAVLRSSLREFLCSEAMFYLGVPTTRALSLVATGEPVVRDMFYDGHPKEEPGAVVCRVAPSFVRFGHFELLMACGEIDNLTRLADYIILQHYPELGAPSQPVYAAWFAEICRRTAIMVTHWMRVGFVHGVMNTDNMSILGLTIDYGPYGWLEHYDPRWTPNTTDAHGRRYCYGNQPHIAFWNLHRLAGALSVLIKDKAALEHGLTIYQETFDQVYSTTLSSKLGISALKGDTDNQLITDLFTLMAKTQPDMTLFFRRLADVPLATDGTEAGNTSLLHPLQSVFYQEEGLDNAQQSAWINWLKRYTARVQAENPDLKERYQRMQQTNPKYVPRNYLAQQAIEAAEQGDTTVLERLMVAIQHPYDDQPEFDDLAQKRPEWARHKAGCSALSCSS